MSVSKPELQEVADVWDDILLGFDGHHQRHYLGLTVPHPAAPRVMLTVRRIVEQVLISPPPAMLTTQEDT